MWAFRMGKAKSENETSWQNLRQSLRYLNYDFPDESGENFIC